MTPLLLTHYTATSGLGRGCAATLAALEAGCGALHACHFDTADLDTQIAEVDGLDELALPYALRAYDCRNNRLAMLALSQDQFAARVRARAVHWGPRRVGVFIGTTTSGIHHTEIAYRRRDPHTGALPPGFDYRCTHNAFSVTDFVRRQLGLAGPAVTVCTACSSSAKVFATAQRMLAAGLIDAAVVGGVDSLCLTTLYGFHSLQLTSPGPCRPFDAGRDGLSIGEAAAFALLERAPDSAAAEDILLLGAGESSDAHHMSSPHPDGLGAAAAMRAALSAAHASPGDIDYINLHGTGTPSNDSAESRATIAIFGGATPCSSTKGATGHTLGAAGALEAVISALALRAGLMPGGLNTRCLDPALPLNYLMAPRRARIARVLSNSFGFGGANCALLLARAG